MKRVAAYCRVSTDKNDQLNSFESQKRYFKEYIERIEEWILTEIYADEGITGTTTKSRAGFLKMIDDARGGAFDLILTKEVSRFSRNILDTISYTRALKQLGIGVIFMSDGISTLDGDAELRLSIMASIAQEESRKTSERVKWGQRRQMERGVVFGRSLLGYDVKHGVMTIEPEGAAVVRTIYRLYLHNKVGAEAIAKELTRRGIPTKTGKDTWAGAAVLKILKNEKYCGDLIQKKTLTPDFLTHKKCANRDAADMIRIENHHEPIIDKEEWLAIQAELRRRSPLRGFSASCGNRYALSGRIVCSDCRLVYLCRTRYRKDGSAYRVWQNLRCACAARYRSLREDTLARCIRLIIQTLDSGDAADALTEILSESPSEKKRTAELSKKIALLEKKRANLIDALLSEMIGKEEYLIIRKDIESELVRLHSQTVEPRQGGAEDSGSEPGETIKRLISGNDGGDEFYLNLVQEIAVFEDGKIGIRLNKMDGTWIVSLNS